MEAVIKKSLSIVAIPGMEVPGNSHYVLVTTQMEHRNTLHGTTLEDHLEATSNAKCSSPHTSKDNSMLSPNSTAGVSLFSTLFLDAIQGAN